MPDTSPTPRQGSEPSACMKSCIVAQETAIAMSSGSSLQQGEERMEARSLRFVSDHLEHRHPYPDAAFLSQLDEKEICWAFGSNAVPKLVNVLGKRQHLSEQESIRVLKLLTDHASNQETKAQLVKNSAVPLICAFLQHWNPEIKRAALTLLAHIARLPTGRDAILDSDALHVFHDLLHDDFSGVRTATAIVLDEVARAPGAAPSFLHAGTLLALVESLKDTCADVLRYSLRAQVGIARAGEAARQALLQESVLPALLPILSGEDDTEVRCLALDLIYALAVTDDAKQGIVEHAMLDAIAAQLPGPNSNFSEFQRASQVATGVLMLLSINLDGKHAVITHPSLLCSIGRLLDAREPRWDDISSNNAIQLLQHVAESPEGRQCIRSVVPTTLHQDMPWLNPRP